MAPFLWHDRYDLEIQCYGTSEFAMGAIFERCELGRVRGLCRAGADNVHESMMWILSMIRMFDGRPERRYSSRACPMVERQSRSTHLSGYSRFSPAVYRSS